METSAFMWWEVNGMHAGDQKFKSSGWLWIFQVQCGPFSEGESRTGRRMQRSEAIRVSKSFYPWSFLGRWFHCVSLKTLQGSWRSMSLSNILGFCTTAEHHISSHGSKAISVLTQSGKSFMFCFLSVPKNPLKIPNSCPLSSACDTEEIELLLHQPPISFRDLAVYIPKLTPQGNLSEWET